MNGSVRKARRPGVSRIQRVSQMSEGLVAVLAQAGFPPDKLLAAFPADLSPDGHFTERWLVVARDALIAVEGDGRRVTGVEPFRGMTALTYRRLVGGGSVLVHRGERLRELIRCSRLTDRAVQAALTKLRDHLGLASSSDVERRPAASPHENHPDRDTTLPREAIPELSAEKAAVFLEQLDTLDEQRFCGTCGLPLKPDMYVCPICVNPGRTLLRVLRLALPYRGHLVALCAILALMGLIGLLPPLIYGQIFDQALVPPTPRAFGERLFRLALLVGAWVGVELFLVLLRVMQGRLSVVIGSGVSRDLRARVFNHLQYLSLAYFDRHKTGALMSRVNSDSHHLEGFLVDGVVWSVISLLQATLVAGMLFWMNWKLGLLVLVPAPFVVFFTRRVWRKIMARFRRLWEVLSRLSAALSDSLRGIRVVKAFGREDQEIARFGRHNQAARDAMVTAEQTWASLMPLLQFVMGLGGYLVWLVGGTLVIHGRETPGTLVSFMGYAPMLYGPLGVLTRVNQWFTRSMTAAERIFEILDTEAEVAEPTDPIPLPTMRGAIELRDVTFAYEKHTPVIRRMNLTITPGQFVGLAGYSGAGKSTTINLVARLYDVDEGQILMDGVDIRRIPLKDLRRQIGVVLQEPFLFSGTILENIAYGRPDADLREVIAAAQMANAHEFIMERPDGYDTEVEEGGSNFSSGEKQRLAIARAILHNPRILILDEATSSVDTKTEKKIQQAMRRLTSGRTTIAIAHRLPTLSGADRLVVLDKGEVREVGTHAELISRRGLYYELVKTQLEMSAAIALSR